MQVASLCKMIVLIILPVSLNKNGQKSWTVPFFTTVTTTFIYKCSRETERLHEEWTLNIISLRNPFFLLALQVKLWLLYVCLLLETTRQQHIVLIELRLKKGQTTPETWAVEAQKDGWPWTPLRSTIARWHSPCLHETAVRGGHLLPLPKMRIWWVARKASPGSCSVLWKIRTQQY